MPAIFISYRREDSIAYSGRLYDRLTAEFGKGQVFMDIDSIDPGADFIEAIEQTVAACDAVLVVIGRQWLTVVDAQGRRRIENPADFVRLEVETALSRKVRVVPVLVGGAQMPRSDELPGALVGLSRRHALDLPDTAFHQTLGRLIESFRRDEAKAREQAEQERLTREGKAQEQSERERLSREAKAREQAERERVAGEAKAREQSEQDRLAREATAREQAEQERIAIERKAPASGTRFPSWAVAALAGTVLVISGAVVYLKTHSQPAPTQTAETPALRSSRTKVNSKDGLTYVWIQPGTFTMRCSPGDSECDADEKPAHEVTISAGFWLGQTPVTQQAYQRVVGTNPSHFKGAQLPVETVNWSEAQSYCQAAGIRMPTEAEWEYAARAGSTGSRYGDIDQIAWYNKNSGSKTHEVAQKQPNAWGLYDMLGNVWQWTSDWYTDKYSGNSETDPHGPNSGIFRSLRGGSWDFGPTNVRVSNRNRNEPENRNNNIGFRCLGMRALS
jgi:formylglycine-generating enzyme required for sulfatase activity